MNKKIAGYTGLIVWILAILACQNPDSSPHPDSSAADVAAAKASLTLVLAEGDSLTSLTQNLSLATTVDQVSVSWVSSNVAVLTDAGLVSRPPAGQPDAAVTLTATLSEGPSTDTKVFDLTVKALPPPPTYVVNIDASKYGYNANVTGTTSMTGKTVSLTNYDNHRGRTDYETLSLTLPAGHYVWKNAGGSGGQYDVYGFARQVIQPNSQLGDWVGWAWGFVAVDAATNVVLFSSDLVAERQTNYPNAYEDVKSLSLGRHGEFTLATEMTLSFAVTDYRRFDNNGGVSLVITATSN